MECPDLTGESVASTDLFKVKIESMCESKEWLSQVTGSVQGTSENPYTFELKYGDLTSDDYEVETVTQMNVETKSKTKKDVNGADEEYYPCPVDRLEIWTTDPFEKYTGDIVKINSLGVLDFKSDTTEEAVEFDFAIKAFQDKEDFTDQNYYRYE